MLTTKCNWPPSHAHMCRYN